MNSSARRAALGAASAAFLSLGALLPQPALAQTGEAADPSEAMMERIEALEGALARGQAELNALRSEVEGLRQAAARARPRPVPAPPALANAAPICRMNSGADMAAAFADPRNLPDCIPRPSANRGTARIPAFTGAAQGTPSSAQGQAAALASAVSQPLPDRPNLAPGIAATLEFSNKGRASVTYTHPVRYRNVATRQGDFHSFRPQLLTLSGGVSVPLTDGEGRLFGITERDDREDADIFSGAAVRLGVDFVSFRPIERLPSFVRAGGFLHRAHQQCASATGVEPMEEGRFLERYGLERIDGNWAFAANAAATPAQACTGDALTAFIFEVEPDPARRDSERFKRPQLAAEYQAMFWTEPASAVPHFGWGLSAEYGTSDFRYSPGSISLVPTAADPTRVQARLDPTVPLGPSRTDTEDDWRIQAYGSLFVQTGNPALTSRISTQGVMFLASAAYLSSHSFRPGTSNLVLCAQPAPGALFTTCPTVNVERPFQRDGITLYGEARTQFVNVPVLRVLGLAPRYSIALDDSRQVLDLPIYLSADATGIGSSGVRVRHSWDGEDLLGNPERANTELSIFFSTPIRFRGF